MGFERPVGNDQLSAAFAELLWVAAARFEPRYWHGHDPWIVLMLQPDSSASHPSLAHATTQRWALARSDILQGLGHWQLWWLLGLNDIRQRYRRSRLGQFWITLSMAMFIGAIGVVYSSLFSMEIRTYLPYLTVNMIVWTFMAGIANDSCTTFTQAEAYIRQERLPKTLFLMRLLVRHMLVLFHNAVLIPIVFLFFGVPSSWTTLLALPGMLLVLVNGFLASLLLAMLCTRFRDLPQIMGNVIQIAFFASPVMWRKQQLVTHAAVVDFNPFASHLMVVSEPLLGAVPSPSAYVMCLVTTLILAAVVLPFFRRFRERIVYWL